MHYVGLDLHWQTSTLVILNEQGHKVKTLTVTGGWKRLLEAVARLPKPFAICFEASLGYGHVYDRLAKLAQRVVVAHPGHLRLIFRSKRKNDRVDAEKLAKLLYMDMVPAVHVPSVDGRAWRELIEFRRRTIDKRTRVKNALRALLRSHGLSKPRGVGGMWTNKGQAWLTSVSWPTRIASLRCQMLQEELQQIERRLKQLTAELDKIARSHAGVALLMTIPGVGPRTAEAVLAYVDDPKRFGKLRAIGAYFGLVPCQDQSAGRNRLGHITKDGPGTARKLLVEAAWQCIRRSEKVRQYFERLVGNDPDRRKIAVVATAHHLLRCMLAMLRSGEAWRPTA